ncbi:hypothetical protein DsansV1_C26g0190791 [Dioscorea sansibarensis]
MIIAFRSSSPFASSLSGAINTFHGISTSRNTMINLPLEPYIDKPLLLQHMFKAFG